MCVVEGDGVCVGVCVCVAGGGGEVAGERERRALKSILGGNSPRSGFCGGS